jgi:hypothetical protein
MVDLDKKDCEKCNKNFLNKSALISHQKVHMKTKQIVKQQKNPEGSF